MHLIVYIVPDLQHCILWGRKYFSMQWAAHLLFSSTSLFWWHCGAPPVLLSATPRWAPLTLVLLFWWTSFKLRKDVPLWWEIVECAGFVAANCSASLGLKDNRKNCWFYSHCRQMLTARYFSLLVSQSKILFLDKFRPVACALLGAEVMLMLLPFGRLLCGLLPRMSSRFSVVN